MKAQIKIKLVALAVLLALAGPATLARDEVPESYGDDYQTGDYGRVRDAEEGLTIVRAQWDHEQSVPDEGSVNSPIFPGDEIATDVGQRAEIELAGGSLVWIDRDTELTFLALPDPYAQIADHAVLQLATGRVRLATTLRQDEELRIDTPAASIYPMGDADLRIEVIGDGRTYVVSRRGVVEVAGNGGSVLVRGGTRTEVVPGSLPRDPEPFNTFAGDGFDRYVEQREDLYRYREGYAGGPEVYRELPAEVQPYYRELSAHGSWSHVDEYGYVWQPAGVDDTWRPYYDGYWGYGPNGYFWISHEPWGWAPYHYGRWSWIGGFGWGWSPGSVFAGAWVSWSWGSAYVGWGPLDYWGYPAYRGSRHYGYYDPYCWTFVGYSHFHHRRYHDHYAHWNHVRPNLHRSAVGTRPPRESPRRLASSAAARERAVRHVRDDARHRIPGGERPRATRESFRKVESRRRAAGDRGGRLRRDTPAAPEGRGRTIPTSSRPRDARAPGSRGDAARGMDRGGRDRLPITTSPRYRRAVDKKTTERGSTTPRSRGGRAPGTRGDDVQGGDRGGRERLPITTSPRYRRTVDKKTTERGSTKPRSRDDRAPGSRGDDVQGGDRGGRERLPVATTPRYRRNLTRESKERPTSPRRERVPAVSTRPQAGDSSSPRAGRDRPETADRLRDLYKKMAKPRQTRERPSASRPSDRSAPSRSRPSEATRSRTKTGGSSRAPAGRSRAKPTSRGEKKSSRSISRSGSSRGGSTARPSRPSRSPGRSVGRGSSRSKSPSRGSQRSRRSGR